MYEHDSRGRWKSISKRIKPNKRVSKRRRQWLFTNGSNVEYDVAEPDKINKCINK